MTAAAHQKLKQGCSIPLALPCLDLLNSVGSGAQFGWHCTLANCSITMVLDMLTHVNGKLALWKQQEQGSGVRPGVRVLALGLQFTSNPVAQSICDLPQIRSTDLIKAPDRYLSALVRHLNRKTGLEA